MLGSDNSRKTPLAPSLHAVAAAHAAAAVHAQGNELPCRVEKVDGQLVTVSLQVFGQPYSGALPNITVPIATGVYDWVPVQVGDLGVVKKSDVYLGQVSGLGSGQADFTPRGNLSALFYVPVSNKSWKLPAVANGDPKIRVVQGPDGVGLQDLPGNTKVLINATSVTIDVKNKTKIVITDSSVTITLASGGKTNVTAGGTLQPVMTATGASPVLFADGP